MNKDKKQIEAQVTEGDTTTEEWVLVDGKLVKVEVSDEDIEAGQ